MADISLSAGVDTSGVAAGMASIENTVTRTANSLASQFTSFLSASTVIAEFHKITTEAQKIHSEATRFGVDAEKLQILANAAIASGSSMEDVARALNLLTINAQKALDPTTKQALALEHLNLSAKAFAAASPDEKFLMLADAYKQSAQDGQAYADVAELVGKKNTGLIDVIKEGSQAVTNHGKALGVMSSDTIRYLAYTREQWETFGNQFQVVIGTMLKKGQDFEDMMERIAQKAHNLLFGYDANAFRAGGGSFGGKGAGSSWPAPISTAAAAELADLSGGGGGNLSDLQLRAQRAFMTDAERLNDLLSQRRELQNQFNDAMAEGDAKAATQADLQKQIATLDLQIAPLEEKISAEKERQLIADEKGAAATDRAIQQSVNRAQLDALHFRAQQEGNYALSQQADLLEISLSFDEAIQRAVDAANDARAKGLDLTAQENEQLAEQLRIEKEQALAEKAKRQEQERTALIGKQISDAAKALAENNLRLGATSDVYAQALAASRGLKPGTPAYDRLVQQIKAEDMVRTLQGRNLGWEEQLNRDKLVQWFANIQSGLAAQRSNQSRNDQLAYWQAIAQGQPAPAGNPFTAFYAPPGGRIASLGTFSELLVNSGLTNTLLQQLLDQIRLGNQHTAAVAANTEIVRI